MCPLSDMSQLDLFYSAERWTPGDAELWGRWRKSLRVQQRAGALLPLQAALSGLVAFRHLENHPLSVHVTDLRPHLHAVRVTYGWALGLVASLRDRAKAGEGLRAGETARDEPEASLRTLERSLTDALRVSERLLELPLVDAGAFQASCDLFLRDLARNTFFRPPEPLEFSNLAEFADPEALAPDLASWKSEAAKMTMVIAFMTLLRDHRFLGIADRQIGADDGLYRAHVVIAAVRRELRALTRFLLVQGVETFADELEARLLTLDAHDITEARAGITGASNDLKELRDSVEALALQLHAKVRSALDGALPDLHPERSHVLPAERMRNGIREVRMTVKDAAKQLRNIGRHLPAERPSGVMAKNIHQDIWAFRFILRAFVAKASVASVRPEQWSDAGSLDFIGEFIRHFRVFGSRLIRATNYTRRGPLMRAVSALSQRETIEPVGLDLAVQECTLFLEHLDEALADVRPSLLAPFDKGRAASELRGYLSAARDRTTADRIAAGAFGSIEPGRAKAS
jgi:hypothetical protein